MRSIPYDIYPLSKWSIVGMNHYYLGGKRHLFCAMVKGSQCIKAEDEQDLEVFSSLLKQAKAIEDAEQSSS